MASKYFVVALAQVLLIQAVFGQRINSGSYITGNSVVENDIYIDGGYGFGAGNLGLGNSNGLLLGGSRPNVGLLSGLGLSNVGLSGLGLSNGYGLSSGTIGLGGCSGLNVASGSPLAVTTISPIGPSGLAVASENAIQGNLLVTGQLPFLSAVAFEGALPTAGSGVASCGCGNGQVGITNVGFGGYPIIY